MNNMEKQLSQQERLEQAFREDEFEVAEPMYDLDAPLPVKKELPLFGGKIGESLGESLERGDDMDPESKTRNR
jgi:hypothetical protein